jgi:hypothetical protein
MKSLKVRRGDDAIAVITRPGVMIVRPLPALLRSGIRS